ncbi:MAG: agmatinase family protein [Pseudomonadota bacterium]|nr:agmatinase family protein [Pseudomonadota bacterium]
MSAPRHLIATALSALALSNAGAGGLLDQGLEQAAQAPIREGEKPVIPLDTKDPSYNIWSTLRDFSKDPKREPGPINIQKYDLGMSWMGIPTFFHLPVALTPEDLKAGKVEVAIMGAYTDMGSGMRGAAHGPNAFRNSEVYGGWGVIATPHMHVMVDPFKQLTAVDYGDAPIDYMSTERSIHAIREFVRQSAAVEYEPGKHVMPIIIGSDHSLMHPDVAALTDVYGKGNVGVIHFDAHYDASKYGMGHLINHGMPVYRLIEEGLVPGKNFIQVGLRGYYPDEESFKWMRENNFRYHTMAEVEKRGWDAVMEDIIAEANDGPDYLFISFDIDVLDPAFVPGTGTPEPGGLTPREAFPLVRRLCAESNVVGFELVELNPLVDPTYVSAMNANRIVRECLTGMAMRKMGLTEKHYLSPLTTDNGQQKEPR